MAQDFKRENDYTESQRRKAWGALYERFNELPVPAELVWMIEADRQNAEAEKSVQAGHTENLNVIRLQMANLRSYLNKLGPDESPNVLTLRKLISPE